jgi:hypothetical protein
MTYGLLGLFSLCHSRSTGDQIGDGHTVKSCLSERNSSKPSDRPKHVYPERERERSYCSSREPLLHCWGARMVSSSTRRCACERRNVGGWLRGRPPFGKTWVPSGTAGFCCAGCFLRVGCGRCRRLLIPCSISAPAAPGQASGVVLRPDGYKRKKPRARDSIRDVVYVIREESPMPLGAGGFGGPP